MTTQGKRGRPKGTGINDHETLLKIAGLIAANPNMKRTTAIKQVGVTNPSVVRRLRDKYQEQERALLAEIAATAAASKPAPDAPAKAEPAKKGKSAAAPAGSPSAPRAASAQAAPQATAQTQQKPAAAGKTAQPADALAALFEGLTIESLISQFLGHVLGIDNKGIEQSPITALIRQQAQLVDLVLPLLMSQLAPQKSAAVKAA